VRAGKFAKVQTPEAVKAAYEANGPRVLEWWLSRDHRCGTRPASWWTFSAPEALRPGETEAEYLSRLELWQPGERKRFLSQQNQPQPAA